MMTSVGAKVPTEVYNKIVKLKELTGLSQNEIIGRLIARGLSIPYRDNFQEALEKVTKE